MKEKKFCQLTTKYPAQMRTEIRLFAAKLEISSGELIRRAVIAYIAELSKRESHEHSQ